MKKVIFSQVDAQNLAGFLERITLRGTEVAAFNSIINALNKAEIIKEEVKQDPKQLELPYDSEVQPTA